MAFIEHTINRDELPENDNNFEALPSGDYVVTVVEADIKQTSKGDGEYIKLKVKVQEGKFVNRTLFANINIKNPSETAEKIGRGQLRDLMTAIGIGSLSDTDQLLGGVLAVTVGQREYNGAMQNDVKRFKAHGAALSVPVSSNLASSASSVSPASKAAPWAKK